MKLCGFEVGLDQPFFLIAGPCVVESEQLQIDTAGTLKEITTELGIPFIFKSSYDKANRSSGKTFRGPGMEEGLRILSEVRKQLGVPILTDVHTEQEVPTVASIVDVLQTPAFLCRQTDFIHAVARSGKPWACSHGFRAGVTHAVARGLPSLPRGAGAIDPPRPSDGCPAE